MLVSPLLMSSAAALAVSGAAPKKASATPTELFGQVYFSSDIAIVSDYRRGGISRSGGHAAIQGGFDIDTESGWSAGVFASTIENRKGANVEIDLYGSKTIEVGETELTIGVTAIIFPGGEDIDFGVAQVSVSRPIGPIDATLSVNYAWEQANLDDEDNLYVSLRARTPIGRFAGVPLTAGASVGHAQGRFAIEDTKLDWSVSVTAEIEGTDIGLSYVDTDIDDERGDAAWVVSIARTF